MSRRPAFVAVLLSAAVTAAARQAPGPADLTDRELEAGGRVYAIRCASCHGVRGDGQVNGSAPVRERDLVALVRRARTAAEVGAAIETPRRAHQPTLVADLDAAARQQLVAWVRSLGGIRLPVRATDGGAGYAWDLPPGFPPPKVPADNPMSAAKVELGRHLFYDTRLSVDSTFSCGTCHEQRLAFTDGRGRAVGVTAQVHPRGAMSLANVAYSPVLTWADPTQRRLETQALVPMFGQTPVEMGLARQERPLLARLGAEPRYPAMFAAAFPGEAAPISVASVTKAIAAFERTLLSGRSPYDRYRTSGSPAGVAPAVLRGEDLFFSERLQCFQCHTGFTFGSAVDFVGRGPAEIAFHNTGLYNLGRDGAYPAPNTGVHAVTGLADDMGRFKAPSLRNIALTAPYMHDGSIRTLPEVIRHYEAGGRTVADGEHKGVGADNPHKSEFVKGFTLSEDERADLVAFLESLTDLAFIGDPRFANPWLQK